MAAQSSAKSTGLGTIYSLIWILRNDSGDARGKFVSGAKYLAAKKSLEDRLETGGTAKELSTKNKIQSSGRVVFWNGE